MTYSTYDEYLRTPEFRAARANAFWRACGRCEADKYEHDGIRRCENLATEVHHVAYCAWGKYDTAENLLAVCHGCHEDAHRCDCCGEVNLKARDIKAGRTTCFDCYSKRQD